MMKPTYMKALFIFSLVLIIAVFGVLVAAPTQNVAAVDTYQEGVDTCNTCHTQAYTPWSASKHNSGNVSCLVCHKLAQGEGAHPDLKYTVETEEVTCAVCHTDVVGADIAGQVATSQHGQIGLKCISCHEPHSQGPKLSTGSTIVCDNCHRKQMETTLKSTHTAAGLSCVNCHMGPENSHTLKVAGETCAGCHNDIHEANRILNAGMDIRLMATPAAVFEKAGEPTEPVAEPKQGGIQLPSWTLIVMGLFIGGIGTWALIGRDPGPPVK